MNAVDNIIYPIVLESVPTNLKISTEEVFGPVVILDDYTNFSEAIQRVNESRFGLQIGVVNAMEAARLAGFSRITFTTQQRR